jgi:hypothetical protein
MARADAGECELVVKGRIQGRDVGYLYIGAGQFRPDQQGDAALSSAQLAALVGGTSEALTYTSVPLGSGVRIGIDRDLDGILDGDE